ncbi:lipoprotein insertase outer membrane protein LolB [Noviherbaspirillum denitrificans]|uniref:Outer-membrane lipoprotein LolB n=1 Tax=Noviherbaspirillum denitrificans TaxID=1968433 RepID=A0A254TJ57_9BURK|nr:lipoprotein insertase outer membrane protein LolB [Noviherbaspirillum denitrificans]OWW20613.1 outer membrane lipoprotein LolB [Noviherbaspirillum denitrificans]
MSLRLARAAAFALPLLLAGCATVTPSLPTTPGVERQFHDAIDIGGRLSVRYQANNREEAVHGSFTWSQSRERTVVTLLSPLGQTMAVVEVDADGATLRQAGQSERNAADVDTLTAQTLGWPLPVSGLREWLQGFAVDSAGKRRTASPAETQFESRDGWRIQYASWPDENPSRPRRIDLARHTGQAGDVSIRIVIDTWQPR